MIGEIISAGANLVGGLMNRESQRQHNAEQARQAELNRKMQLDFAQHGIKWKVDDARDAGIHPLYALGANTVSYSPVSLGGAADSSLGTAMAAAGQDLSRAMNSTRTQPERDEAYTKTVQQLSLQKMGLENDLLASQIAKLRSSSNPPMPDAAFKPDGIVPSAKEFEDRPELRMAGGPWATSPHWTNAEDYEKRYGEMSDWVYGPQIMWADYKANYGAPTWLPTFRPGSWLHRTFGDSFDARFGKWGRR